MTENTIHRIWENSTKACRKRHNRRGDQKGCCDVKACCTLDNNEQEYFSMLTEKSIEIKTGQRIYHCRELKSQIFIKKEKYKALD